MKKENRLLKNKDFKKVLDGKKSIASDCYVVYVKKSEDKTRVGISVSSKIGNSVIRHKIKRQINEILKELDYNKNLDIVIIARKIYLQKTFEENKKDLLKLINKINQKLEGKF